MAIKDSDFCDSYTAHKKLKDYIKDPTQDPTYLEFLRNYADWEKAGSSASLGDMFFFFDSPADSRRALKAGADPAKAGRVRKKDCEKHRKFVLDGEPELVNLYASVASLGDDKSLTPFEAAVHAFSTGTSMTVPMRGLLNGAAFLYNNTETDVDSSKSAPVGEFYAIPGRYLMRHGLKPLDKGPWAGILSHVKKATQASGLNTINLNLAVQLRLGKKDITTLYLPIPVGPGFIIFGGD